MEWTRTWGVNSRTSTLEIRYLGRLTTGVGRPGIVPSSRGGIMIDAVSSLAAQNILAAPSGPLTLTDLSVVTHQFSVSLPLR
jgi:hypothetical protein